MASQLTDDRREKLERIGFTWHVRTHSEWDDRYKQLIEYRAIHGDCQVPASYKENPALGTFPEGITLATGCRCTQQ